MRQQSLRLELSVTQSPSFFISDTYASLTQGTYRASIAAADAALTGARHLLHGERTIYSLCRPPGHHAAHHAMGGYCYFNNAAIAANYLSAHGRVAILDIDYHHGNGTQEAFYDRNDVLYISLHADPSQSYPYISGFAHEIGRGQGIGCTINYPLAQNTTNQAYVRNLRKAISDIEHFEPSYIVVSAGFDTYNLDPIGGMRLTQEVYQECGSIISELNVPTLIVQEGGYCIEDLGMLTANFLAGFPD